MESGHGKRNEYSRSQCSIIHCLSGNTFTFFQYLDYTLNVAVCKDFSFYILWYSFNRIMMSQKRKLWSQESMRAVVQSVQEGKGL